MEIQSQLQRLIASMEDARNELRKNGRAALTEFFAGVFQKNPDVIALRWEQFTPCFNDGDPCIFRVGDLECMMSNAEDEDDWNSLSYISGLEESARTFVKIPSEFLLVLFGDHAQVTVSRDAPAIFSVAEYDHD